MSDILNSIRSPLVVAGLHMPLPRVFWNGRELTGLRDFMCHNRCDGDDTPIIRLRVDPAVAGFDDVYAAMEAAGINIKKGN